MARRVRIIVRGDVGGLACGIVAGGRVGIVAGGSCLRAFERDVSHAVDGRERRRMPAAWKLALLATAAAVLAGLVILAMVVTVRALEGR